MADPVQIDVAHIATLARLHITEEERNLFQSQLARVLEYAEKLQEPDTSQVDAASHAAPIHNVFREDETRSGLSVADALSNAPRQANDLVIVTKVVE